MTILDLPGTYSLRGRSPDEEITREVVFGELTGEKTPDCIVCVADATNLRLSFRLLLELKQVGRPMLLVLNMIDLARRRGIVFDLDRLSSELGIPVVTAVSVRKGGTADLLAHLDALAPESGAPRASTWRPHSASELRALQREADRIITATVTPPARPDTATTRIDSVVLHPVAGLLILLTVLFVMFQAVFSWAQPAMELLSGAFASLGQFVHNELPGGLLQSFLQNGVISGVGSVVVFLPQILILFLFILLLEDFGYMARAAFLMDRIMGGAGLHGRAFIPLLSSFACAIPGIMAARVIDNRRDRLTTILIAPLMTCSARIPVYTLIISAFIPQRELFGFINLQGLVMFGLYAAGIASALLVSFVAKIAMWRDYEPSPFMMELPDYKLPRAKSVALGLYMRAKMFLQRAGTTIFSMMVLIWFLASFPQAPGRCRGPRHQLQPRGDDRTRDRTCAGAARLQLADRGRAYSGHGRARSCRGRARHGLRHRGRQGGRGADRAGARQQLEPRHRAVTAGLVHLRAAMRLDAGGDPARDRQLEMDGHHLRLHAGAGLCGIVGYLQYRARIGFGLELRYFNGSGWSPSIPLAMTLRATTTSSECCAIRSWHSATIWSVSCISLSSL